MMDMWEFDRSSPYVKHQITAVMNVHTADPEQQLAAAVILSSMQAARAGDLLEVAWLAHCSKQWLSFICPPWSDVDEVYVQLMDTVIEDIPDYIEIPSKKESQEAARKVLKRIEDRQRNKRDEEYEF